MADNEEIFFSDDDESHTHSPFPSSRPYIPLSITEAPFPNSRPHIPSSITEASKLTIIYSCCGKCSCEKCVTEKEDFLKRIKQLEEKIETIWMHPAIPGGKLLAIEAQEELEESMKETITTCVISSDGTRTTKEFSESK